jgi:hypothetical protein
MDKASFHWLAILCFAKQVNFSNEITALNRFNLKLDKTQNKAGGVISLIDSGLLHEL